MNVRMRICRPSLMLAWAMVLGMPALAHAQLFPNLPIRRQRPACAAENPQFSVIRQEYWGYYPTCWQRFPGGWGCKSAEAPNWAKEKEVMPIDKPAAPDAAGEGPAERPAPVAEKPMTNPDGDLPAVPQGNPFDPIPKPAGNAPASPSPPNTPPAAAPPNTPGPGNQPTSLQAPRRRTPLISSLLSWRRSDP